MRESRTEKFLHRHYLKQKAGGIIFDLGKIKRLGGES